IPRELDEAAMLDGASRWTIFWRVILPLTKPAQSTLAVFTFLGAWNDYWWPLISATHSNMYTLTVRIAAAQMNYAQTSGLGYLMAQAVFASIPIFIVYIVFQKQIVRAMAGTAVRWGASPRHCWPCWRSVVARGRIPGRTSPSSGFSGNAAPNMAAASTSRRPR